MLERGENQEKFHAFFILDRSPLAVRSGGRSKTVFENGKDADSKKLQNYKCK